jgi:hypothetical protein
VAEDVAAGGQLLVPDTNYSRVKFAGMGFDELDPDANPKIGEEMSFRVRGRVVGIGDDEMADGQVRHIVKVKISSVLLND